MGEMKAPESVRTPGRTWTEFPGELGDSGEGDVEVEAPEEVEVREALENELFEQAEVENAVDERHSREIRTSDTVYIRIPGGAAVEEPVRIDTELRSGFFPSHVIVVAEEGSSATVVERNSGEGRIDSSIVEVRVREDAH
ncbi:MAG: hypothetical protein SVS85_02285, partial [Candidatus Nanohaloarchaea archaeon]|nr:hypothetical protein [Candidatus Nanohaloarchaea archaeon]